MVSNKGIVVGIYDDLQFSSSNFASYASVAQETVVSQLKALSFKGKVGDSFVCFGSVTSEASTQVAIVGLGKKEEDKFIHIENIRTATAVGVRALIERKVSEIEVDISDNAYAAAEGAYLAAFKYDATKSDKFTPPSIKPISLNSPSSSLSETETAEWNRGKVYADSQNWAKNLATTPANKMTPTIFGEEVSRELSQFKNIQVNVHDRSWAEKNNMGLFLGVSNGSVEPPRFVEIIYKGCSQEKPVAFVGKGVTFDAGGISLKPSKGMDLMKADMGGGAAVVAAMRGIAALKLPVYAVACVPLTENLPSGSATKPGDIHRGMNGKTVEILNTDAEGRLILADALTYVVDTYKPTTVIDVATLTGAMVVALGEVYSGIFTASDTLWDSLHSASKETGDSVWRMPLHSTYLKSMESKCADIANISNSFGAGSAAAAMFLREFVGTTDKTDIVNEQNADRPSEAEPRWAHMDIAGTMETFSNSGYNSSGLTGRPTRTLIEFAKSASK
ncbi:hypothetical protein BB560_004414 [Smittium megazygosporum]|uniref:Cytosol aminopeptidase domain-containing protein n=1 Tax=Smittium megazygosporum TaxID=133381 RepID=A0A2T9Z997_9FUNG|nr:hypothetical protein BB560_005803 [Smittium megazygosporum]PVV01179.1 hypothetical protein BB560_004414 [Smittium megazygosporum]